jgi:gas vesicle protein
MAHHDEVPYVIIERRSGGASAFLLGALAGAAAALLFAPGSGRQTRDELRAGALRLRDRAEDAVRSVSDSITGAVGGVRDEVEDRLDRARDAFDAGREAARRSRDEMEARVREVRTGARDAAEAARTPADGGSTIITSTSATADDDPDSNLGI